MEAKEYLIRLARESCEKNFDPEKLIVVIPRETTWYAITLFESGKKEDIDLANRLIENLPDWDGTHTSATLCVIYHRYPTLLSLKGKRRIEEYLKTCIPKAATTTYQSGNVNHPLGAYATLTVGGAIIKDDLVVRIGGRLLWQFESWLKGRSSPLRRVATYAEYNSPTYTAADLWFLNIIANYCPYSDIARLARYLEERMWVDVACHFHQPSHQLAGPHSRAYQEGSTGGICLLTSTMLKAFHRYIYLNPQLDIDYNHEADLMGLALPAVLDFNVPEEAVRIAFEKKFPYLVQAVTYCKQYHENFTIEESGEKIPIGDDEVFPGGFGDITTYMTEEYALGTSSRQYVNGGHNDTFVIRYRRAKEIKSMSYFRSIYTRYIMNKAQVDQDNFSHLVGRKIKKTYLYEEGRDSIFQHKNKAIVCYSPKRAGYKKCRSLRLDIILGYFSPLDEMRVGKREVNSFPFDFDWKEKVYIRDYRTYIAFIPLEPKDKGRKTSGRIWRTKNHLVISLYNYEGLEKNFTREEMSLMRNGFICELGDKREFKDIDEFMSFINKTQVEEKVDPAGIRTINYKSGDEEMLMIYDPRRDMILHRSVNGKEVTISHFYCEMQGETGGTFCPKTIY